MFSTVRRALLCILPVRHTARPTRPPPTTVVAAPTRPLTRPSRYANLRVTTPSLDQYEDVAQVTPNEVINLVLPRAHPVRPTVRSIVAVRSPHPSRVTYRRLADMNGRI